jgi:hypothetical protein
MMPSVHGNATVSLRVAGAANVVQRMTELREAGMGCDRIAAALNAESIKPRRGKSGWACSRRDPVKG